MMAAWMMSASVTICRSPNMYLSIENTRSAAAEFGVNAKTIWAAPAHAGNLEPLTFHQEISEKSALFLEEISKK